LRKIIFWGLILVVAYVVGVEEGWLPELPFDKGPGPRPAAISESSSPSSTDDEVAEPVAVKTVDPKQVLLYVDSIPQGAKILLNNSGDPKYTPFEFADLPTSSKHRLLIQMHGYRPYQETFHLHEGEKKVVVVHLEKTKD